jgi:hypothetical protein
MELVRPSFDSGAIQRRARTARTDRVAGRSRAAIYGYPLLWRA